MIDMMTTRLPANYRTILEVVTSLGPGSHVTAADVYTRVKLVRPRIGYTTVHRGLTRLHELGHLLKLDLPGAASAIYEPAASPHAHFRCTDCGRIEDVAYTVPGGERHAIDARYGVHIATESVTFTGRCAACAGREPFGDD